MFFFLSAINLTHLLQLKLGSERSPLLGSAPCLLACLLVSVCITDNVATPLTHGMRELATSFWKPPLELPSSQFALVLEGHCFIVPTPPWAFLLPWPLARFAFCGVAHSLLLLIHILVHVAFCIPFHFSPHFQCGEMLWVWGFSSGLINPLGL